MIRKRDIKGRKHIAPMDFAEYLRKSDVSENGKVYYGRFLRNGLHERHFFFYNIIDYNWTRQKINEKYITKR